jgi:hypothetical protein
MPTTTDGPEPYDRAMRSYASARSRARVSTALRPGHVLAALAVAALVLAACAPATLADGSVRLRPERHGDAWVVSVPPGAAGRSLVIARAFTRSVTVPRGFVPPPGTCRIWHRDRPPALQPAFGPCRVLELNVPAGSYLIRG